MKNVKGKFSAVVLCSNGNGPEDSTTAAVYLLNVRENEVDKSLIKASGDGGDWEFKVKGSSVVATGPAGPTRYGVVSNLLANGSSSVIAPFGCLATGADEAVRGAITVTQESITGWVSKPSDISIKMNEKTVARYAANQLQSSGGKSAFKRDFTDHEKMPGLYLVRVYAIQPHKNGDSSFYVQFF